MKYLQILVIASFLLGSCGQSETPIATKEAEKKPIEKVVANKMLTFEITGMTCVMGCGGSIRKELSATNAVEKCEFEFEAGRDINTVKVSFDQNKTSPADIIKIVTTMNDRQFKVGAKETTDVSMSIKTKMENIEPTAGKTKEHS